MEENCMACGLPFKTGDHYYPDVSGGTLHAECLGTERECFVKDLDSGEPLGDGDPIPKPRIWGIS